MYTLSLSNALDRCEILVFATSSISPNLISYQQAASMREELPTFDQSIMAQI